MAKVWNKAKDCSVAGGGHGAHTYKNRRGVEVDVEPDEYFGICMGEFYATLVESVAAGGAAAKIGLYAKEAGLPLRLLLKVVSEGVGAVIDPIPLGANLYGVARRFTTSGLMERVLAQSAKQAAEKIALDSASAAGKRDLEEWLKESAERSMQGLTPKKLPTSVALEVGRDPSTNLARLASALTQVNTDLRVAAARDLGHVVADDAVRAAYRETSDSLKKEMQSAMNETFATLSKQGGKVERARIMAQSLVITVYGNPAFKGFERQSLRTLSIANRWLSNANEATLIRAMAVLENYARYAVTQKRDISEYLARIFGNEVAFEFFTSKLTAFMAANAKTLTEDSLVNPLKEAVPDLPDPPVLKVGKVDAKNK